MNKGKFSGFFAWGQNPAVSGADAGKTRKALASLDWMVNVNMFENETGSFWQGPGMDPEKIKTEVFFLPCAVFAEKEGSVTNSGRWSQWRYKAVEPPENALGDGDIILRIFKKVRRLYEKDPAPVFPYPVMNIKLDYETCGRFDPHKIAKQINGYFEKEITVDGQTFKKGDLVPDFTYLQNNGTTSCGNWLYCGSYTSDGNMAARRKKETSGIGLHSQWAWCWPLNRRILYNRASVDLNGNSWNPKRPVISWDAGKKIWTGDVADGPWPPFLNPDGTTNAQTRYPFIMKSEGLAEIFGRTGVDGPLPEHYEPLESPVSVNPFSCQRINPVLQQHDQIKSFFADSEAKFPYVATTYRVSEHWQSGVMSRWIPWLLESQPRMFVEISPELARLKNIENGEIIRVANNRGQLECLAMVTVRIRPFIIQGCVVHQIGLPWHFGWVHPKNGDDSANLLTLSAGDPNTGIPETKAFMVNIEKLMEP
jgi:formate dehydrogenase major subunit